MRKPTSSDSGQYARVFGSPGEGARLAGLARVVWPVFAGTLLAGYLLRAALPVPPLSATLAGVLLLLLAGGLALAAYFSRPRLAAFIKGAKGEEWVARELALLPADYTVFNGLASRQGVLRPQAGDYDHVVVGPTGVLLIETKNWSARVNVQDGRVLYNGRVPTRSPLDQVKRGAHSLEGRLRDGCGCDARVTPIVCFADASGDVYSLFTLWLTISGGWRRWARYGTACENAAATGSGSTSRTIAADTSLANGSRPSSWRMGRGVSRSVCTFT
jgi:hypothetical protein